MLDFTDAVTVTPEGVISVQFEMTNELYEDIKSVDAVQDFALGILSAVERVRNKQIVDNPDMPAVELSE